MSSGNWVKDGSNFIKLETGLEMPFHKQDGFITPNDDFFVLSAGDTPRVDVSTWSLHLKGDGLDRVLNLSYDDLCAMPQKSMPVGLECAGNHRRLFEDVMNQPLDRRPEMTEVRWGLGGVGCAEWEGASLREILQQAGIRSDAYHVCPVGLDRGYEDDDGIRAPMSVDKAMDPDTLVALRMNGVPLPPDHGFPARLIVPGWVGTYSIKWLDRIDVTTTHQWAPRNTEFYVMMGDDWPTNDYGPANGAPISEQPIRSSLALPWPARLEAGHQRLHGYARSCEAAITGVEWSSDNGDSWIPAQLVSPIHKHAWVQFSIEWQATSGEHTLMTRATDEQGRTQPMEIPFNNGGYLFNMVHPHPIVVR